MQVEEIWVGVWEDVPDASSSCEIVGRVFDLHITQVVCKVYLISGRVYAVILWETIFILRMNVMEGGRACTVYEARVSIMHFLTSKTLLTTCAPKHHRFNKLALIIIQILWLMPI